MRDGVLGEVRSAADVDELLAGSADIVRWARSSPPQYITQSQADRILERASLRFRT
jgi:hypothetical protein